MTGSFSPEQTELFHHWLTLMFKADNEIFGELKVEDALNNAKTPATANKPMGTIIHLAQSFIDQLRKEKWIIVVSSEKWFRAFSDAGFVHATTRTCY